MSFKEGKILAHLQSKRDQAEGLAVFRFELEDQFFFQPGQYATLWLTHRGQTVPRPYSIASSPSYPRVLEFYINLVDSGHLSPSFWNEEVLRCLEHRDPDTKLLISGPKGRFLLDPQDSRDLVFVASGTGLAPFMSMIRKLNENFVSSPRTFLRRSIHVIHGVSRSNHLGYREELEQLAAESLRNPARRLAITYLPTISRPQLDPSWTGLTGRAESLFNCALGADRGAHDLQTVVRGVLQSILRPETHAIYVCGYPGTVDNVMRLLSARGFKPDLDLKREKYYP
jgi:ferredoxin-NADP reductase